MSRLRLSRDKRREDSMTTAHINAIGTAVPPHKVHDAFIGFVHGWLNDSDRKLFDRMVRRSGISQRFSFVLPEFLDDGRVKDSDDFYGLGDWPSTAERMERYQEWAPRLAIEAIDALDGDIAKAGITHLVVASCTGFVAPGIDQMIVAETGIDPTVERTLIGFMGCYAAVNALRAAHHIVRSEPDAKVLVVAVELCSLHFQRSSDLKKLLPMLQFGDGAAAAIVSADEAGIALRDFRSAAIPDSDDAITWHIGNDGFDMHLDGRVPSRIADALSLELQRNDDHGLLRGQPPEAFGAWAVHAGGRTILDAVERSLNLPKEALSHSRDILKRFGNMSSATLMFVLQGMMSGRMTSRGDPTDGMAMAFGPGMAAESFRFRLL